MEADQELLPQTPPNTDHKLWSQALLCLYFIQNSSYQNNTTGKHDYSNIAELLLN